MDEKIDILRKEYASQLPQKMRDLKRTIEEIVKALGQNSVPSWIELGLLSHKMAGSAGTYGFSHLSAVARFIDELIANKTLAKLPPKTAAVFLVKWIQVLSEQAKLADQGAQPHESIEELIQPLQRLLEDNSNPKRRVA